MQYLIVVSNKIILYDTASHFFPVCRYSRFVARIRDTEVARCFIVNINCTCDACTIWRSAKIS